MIRKFFPFLIAFLFLFPLMAQEENAQKAEELLQAIEKSKEDSKTQDKVDQKRAGDTAKDEAVKEATDGQDTLSDETSEIEESADVVPPVIKEMKKERIGGGKAQLLSPAIHGQTGLFRVYSAQRQEASLSSIGLSMHGEWFKQRNFFAAADEISRWRWAVAATYAPVKYVEIFASVFAVTNTGKINASLLQRMGDLRTGVKLGYDLGLISFGTNFTAEILNGAGDVNIQENSYSYDLKALATADFLKCHDIPIRLHANVGYRWDGTIDAAGAALLGAAERFFLDIVPRDQITFGFGFEVPIEVVSLFAEYTFEKVKSFSFGNSPQRITSGLKVFPTKTRGITLDFGTDVRIANKDRTTRAIGLPKYNLIFGMTVTHSGRAQAREIAAVVTKGSLAGTVMDPDTSTGIAGAVISFDDGLRNSIISKPDGSYTIADLPQGVQPLTVTKDGYDRLNVSPTVVAGETMTLDLIMNKSKDEKGALIFQIYDADDKPLKGSLSFLDYPNLKPYTVDTAKGGLKVKLKQGDYRVKVSAEKFEAEEKTVKIEGGKEATNRTTLREIESKVEIQKDKIIIKDKIHFATGKAEIKTESLSLLNRVADVMADNLDKIKKLRIEGYTDSVGSAELNLRLSQKRAEAVKDYLVIRGIEEERLEAVGYGQINPIAPNSTPQGRAINRRVEFTILGE